MARPTVDECRHLLLEGFLLRLARSPSAEAFVLRGGMLIRQWFRGRAALDADLVYRLPYDRETLRRELTAALQDRSVPDGIAFHPERLRLDEIWVDTPHPGLRMYTVGTVDGRPADLRADLTFGLDPWPPPRRERFEGARGATSLWTCRPETLVGRKLQVVTALGRRRWRPKDLDDVRRILGGLELDPRSLGEALEASFVGADGSVEQVREILERDSWWDDRYSAGRWLDFVGRSGRAVPEDLGAVIGEIRGGLRPILGSGGWRA